jgi:DNA helicase-2/ATP-dependent DNA helicase PcrA
MVKERLVSCKTKDEFQQIMEHIHNGHNFLLSGGAGSGKTFSLVQVIKQVILENPTAEIACMTYTNAAVKEIEERVNHNNLYVSTIHDFLWDNIKHYKQELKKVLVGLLNNETVPELTIETPNPVPDEYFDQFENGIQYKEYLRIKEGIISHDEVLYVANKMFHDYPKLCDVLKDKFKYIFIDEYPDTNSKVVSIFLNHFKSSEKLCVIGFFGDAMQSIYEDGIGDLNEYLGEEVGHVREVKKEQNRRNPRLVYELANKLRTDGLLQTHSLDKNAPNMVNGVVKEGDIKFLYSSNPSLENVRNSLGWDFSDSKETKELNLTHNLIADKAKFRTLMDIYDKERLIELKNVLSRRIKDENITIPDTASFGDVITQLNYQISDRNAIGRFINEHLDLYKIACSYSFKIFRQFYVSKDQLLDDKKQDQDDENKKGSKRDNLIKHLFKIQNNIFLYQKKKYNEFLRKTNYKIKSIEDKIILKQNIESLINVGDRSIEEVIIEANRYGICLIDESLEKFQKENEYLYNRVKQVKFSEFQKLYEYLEGYTPFSTQHKVKGAEFNNVLVILDNGGWNNSYNFENMFLESGNANVLKKSQKIFYMCCTRTKENLGVFFHSPKPAVISKAIEWFGDSNVKNIDDNC